MTNSGKSRNLYDLNEKLTNARQNRFVFNQKNKLTIKTYSSLSNKNIHCYLKLNIPRMHRQLYEILFQNKEYVERFCNDRNNPFHFASRR